MTDAAPDPVVHAAVFASLDPATITSLIVIAKASQVALNVPAGGCWRSLPAGVLRAQDCPPLGELPAPAASG